MRNACTPAQCRRFFLRRRGATPVVGRLFHASTNRKKSKIIASG
jgi:hypothetical protein